MYVSHVTFLPHFFIDVVDILMSNLLVDYDIFHVYGLEIP